MQEKNIEVLIEALRTNFYSTMSAWRNYTDVGSTKHGEPIKSVRNSKAYKVAEEMLGCLMIKALKNLCEASDLFPKEKKSYLIGIALWKTDM